jgi:hypothetical protein
MGHEKPTEEALSTANSEASELKEKGNEAYKNDNLDDALAFYTQGNFFLVFKSVSSHLSWISSVRIRLGPWMGTIILNRIPKSRNGP